MRRRPWRAFLRQLRERAAGEHRDRSGAEARQQPFADVDAAWSRQQHHPAISLSEVPELRAHGGARAIVSAAGGSGTFATASTSTGAFRTRSVGTVFSIGAARHWRATWCCRRASRVLPIPAYSISWTAKPVALRFTRNYWRWHQRWYRNGSCASGPPTSRAELTALLRQARLPTRARAKQRGTAASRAAAAAPGQSAARSAWTHADRPLLDLQSWDLRLLYSMHG